jgi:hypothetical protein
MIRIQLQATKLWNGTEFIPDDDHMTLAALARVVRTLAAKDSDTVLSR